MNSSLTIRNAKTHEAGDISALAMRSKAYWGYSQEFMEACREELTATANDIAMSDFRYMLTEQDSKLLGYYAIEKLTENEYELEALFVEPAHIGTGVGKALIDHAKNTVKELGGKTLLIQGDPNAEKFYRAAGGSPVGMRKSASIPGRNLPLFIIELTNELYNDEKTVLTVRQWIKTFVVEMNLCPFARNEMLNNRVRFVTTEARTEEQLLMSLQDELSLLNKDPSIETTLLIHSDVLQDFHDYNQFLNYVDKFLLDSGFEGVYQIASFHPDYQFDGTNADDAENYTNRSPYPMLHILREESLERAIAEYPDVEQIPARNVVLMNSFGRHKLQALFEGCKKLYDGNDS